MLKKFFAKEVYFVSDNNDTTFSCSLKGNVLELSHLINGTVSDTRLMRAGLIKRIKIRLYYALHF